jgi:NAD dependent epimerase/dehydratase
MNWTGIPALVTGACGFIGSRLVETLVARGARVTALALYDARGSRGWLDDLPAGIRREMAIVSGDVRDAEQMRRLAPAGGVIFHLAALIGIPYSYDAPRSYVDTNVTGTLNLLEAARAAPARRILVISTSEVYGTALRVPIDEDHPLQAQSPYAASKIAAEKLAESYWRSFDLPATVVRPFNTFGPRQSLRAVIPTILLQLLRGCDRLALGDPETRRDFTFVEDTAEGLVRLAECDAALGQVVNIGTGRDVSIREVAEQAQTLTGRQVPLETRTERLRPPASEVRRLQADASRLRALTGWSPQTPLAHGLARTIEWLTPRLDRYDPERYYV